MKNETYEEFVEKFKPKKTTDDCYTPKAVYEAIAQWVAKKYNLKQDEFCRPFYPGGDYEHFDYSGKVVVDNPPFSIITKICDFYGSKGIKFFLFAPTLTLFSGGMMKYTVLPCGATIVYENGAKVNTSFVTNLEPREILVRSEPELYKIIEVVNKQEANKKTKTLPKYEYPMSVITSCQFYQFSKHGVDFSVKRKDCSIIDALDGQKTAGKAIFGKGLLLSESCKAEREKAEREKVERWELSQREIELIANME